MEGPFDFSTSKSVSIVSELNKNSPWRKEFSLRDVITGEVIESSTNGDINGLSYFKAVLASRKDIIRITKKYESMSSQDISRYKDAINKIKEISINKFIEKEKLLSQEIYEEKKARDFLINFQQWGA